MSSNTKDTTNTKTILNRCLPRVGVLVVTLSLAACPGLDDFSTELSGGYFVHRTSAHQIIVAPQGWNDATPIIPTKVVAVAYDSDWILAAQQHLRRRSPDDPSDTYEEPDPGVFSFWIRNVTTPRLSGPLTYKEFVAKRIELEVDSSLRLHDVYELR